ncbi:MAG: TolC family protein [Flavobacteriales bacterium]|nr:TolC family protein [Flavobacteriales bacterium]
MTRPTLLLLAILGHATLSAQDSIVLPRAAVVRMVIENHPIARQAALRTAMGEATVQSARGGFDPLLSASYDNKEYDDKEYYALFDAGLKVPTWYGVELLGGYALNDGQQLDPMDVTPSDGLLKAGVSVTVGQGLFIDQRRATLQRARAFQQVAEGERRQLLNSILFQALSDHADWTAAYASLGVAREGVELTRTRYEAVKGSWRGGDRPAIDTLEAFLQLQDRQLREQQAELAFRNAGLRLANHLWDPQLRPLELAPTTRPDERELYAAGLDLPSDTLVGFAQREHPSLLQASARIDQFEVDRRLRAELLKPTLDVKYLFLGDGAALSDPIEGSLLGDGQQLGVGFRMPLLLRRERGELSLARLRLTEAQLGLERDRLVVGNRVRERLNEVTTLRAQVDLGASAVRNYRGLLNGESQRFAAGESSLFLVNVREVSLLEERLRQVDREVRLTKAHFAVQQEAGVLWSAYAR